jgi:Flp pilus assembly protein TadD
MWTAIGGSLDRTETLRTYLAEKPDDRFARYALALELKRMGDLHAAESELRQMLAVHRTSGPGWLQLGNVLVEQGRDADAAGVWREGVKALDGLASADATKSRAELLAALATVDG